MLSKELQMGKAAEHLVCADLILQGHSAFLADQGLPYDVIVDQGSRLYRVQVKSTSKVFVGPKCPSGVYRFTLRSGKKGVRRITESDVDVFAFVALDIRTVAYLPSPMVTTKDGSLKLLMEFRVSSQAGDARIYDPLRGKPITGFPDFPSLDAITEQEHIFAPVRKFLSNARTYRLVSPEGEEIITSHLAQFCRERGLSLTGLLNVDRQEATHCKGWGCQRLFDKSEVTAIG